MKKKKTMFLIFSERPEQFSRLVNRKLLRDPKGKKEFGKAKILLQELENSKKYSSPAKAVLDMIR